MYEGMVGVKIDIGELEKSGGRRRKCQRNRGKNVRLTVEGLAFRAAKVRGEGIGKMTWRNGAVRDWWDEQIVSGWPVRWQSE